MTTSLASSHLNFDSEVRETFIAGNLKNCIDQWLAVTSDEAVLNMFQV